MKTTLNGEAVRKIRAERLITQQQLAQMAGIRVETLCRLELGRRPANAKTVQKIAAALELDAKSLIVVG